MALREKRHPEPFYSDIQIKISLITSHSNRRKTPLKEAVYARWCGYGEKISPGPTPQKLKITINGYFYFLWCGYGESDADLILGKDT